MPQLFLWLSFALVLVMPPHFLAGQDYDQRYRPLEIAPLETPKQELPSLPNEKENEKKNEKPVDDRTLVSSLDAVILVDSADKVSKKKELDDLTEIHYQFQAQDSIVFDYQIKQIIEQYLGQPISLRSLNQLAADISKHYKKQKQPIVDVQIPEQRITGGTVHLVVVESEIGDVRLQLGRYFDCSEISRWIACTKSGRRVYEPDLESDLFWLNQNPFRYATLDFEKGTQEGTTDVIFKMEDYFPFRYYAGIDDSGVESLNYGRFFTGFQYGNFLGKGGTLGYQYTGDEELSLLEAHSLSWNQPINRNFSLGTYASWSGVSPALGFGLSQEGESWQFGSTLTRHLIRNRKHQRNLTLGYDFKSTNNNLAFAGSNISGANAELFQIRFGMDDLVRTDIDQYRSFRVNTFIGPGGGLTSGNSTAAFNTIRPGTSPDYIYATMAWERHQLVAPCFLLASRFSAQASSERLLFSETFGLGGYNTIRGTDQRDYNADHGWSASFELGPPTIRWGETEKSKSLRLYGFIDLGNGYLDSPTAGEDRSTFAASTGIGGRFQLSDRLIARVDYGTAFEKFDGSNRNSRAHFGLTWISKKRR